MVITSRSFVAALAALIAFGFSSLDPQERSITVASTPSTAKSGLFPPPLTRLAHKPGTDVRGCARGSAQALHLERAGATTRRVVDTPPRAA